METEFSQIARRPIFFERNRVFRVYEGGMLFGGFFGEPAVDGNYPEEWIASAVKALNRDSTDPEEGLSRILGTDISFRELLSREPGLMLGEGGNFNVLVKILDSAIRLPIQTHPDPEFSRQYFKSEYGKTESWLILATRPGASVFFGFNRKISKTEFSMAVERSKIDKNSMTGLLNEIKVKAGEVYLIPAKVVHAIGCGCLILEVQEPTDFTIQPEYWCGKYQLNEYEMYLGLAKDVALNCFDYDRYGEKILEVALKKPRIEFESPTVVQEELIGRNDTPCFSVKRLTVTNGSVPLTEAPAIYIVTEGSGILIGSTLSIPVSTGSFFFLPYAAANSYSFSSTSKMKVVMCLPPKSGNTVSH